MPRESFTPSGIILDIPATELNPNVWTGGNNIVFRRGLAQAASKGVVAFPTPTSAPLNVVSSIDFELNAWLYGADDGAAKDIYVTDGASHKLITPTGFIPWVDSQANSFTDGNISGFPFMNWGTQSAYWTRDFATPALMTLIVGLNNDPTPVPEAGWVPVCKAMRSHQNRVMCINTENDSSGNFPASEETLVWSSLPAPDPTAFPDDFFPRITNNAGDVQLSGGGPLIDGKSLRSSFIIYGQDRTWIADEIGGTFVFAFRHLSSATGALSRNCIANTPEGHIVLSGDDIYINDGQSFRSIVDNEIKVSLFSELGDNWFSAFLVYYAARAELWCCIPNGGDIYPTKAYIYDTGTKKWGIRDLSISGGGIPGADTGPVPFPETNDPTWDGQPAAPEGEWDNATRIWNKAVLASAASGLILADPDLANSGANKRFISMDKLINGANANLYRIPIIRRQDLDLGDASRLKTVSRIWPRIDGSEGDDMFLRLGVRDTLDDSSIAYSPYTRFFVGEDQKIDIFGTGRYITVEFSTQRANIERLFTVNGFSIEFEFAGKF